MARTDPTIYMRIPQGLKDKLDAAAESNHSSLTAEVVRRLSESFESPRLGFGPGSVGDQLDRVRDEALERLEATAQEISERVAALIAEKMKAGEK
jgi:predicted DNA-binding protein